MPLKKRNLTTKVKDGVIKVLLPIVVKAVAVRVHKIRYLSQRITKKTRTTQKRVTSPKTG